MHISFITDLKG